MANLVLYNAPQSTCSQGGGADFYPSTRRNLAVSRIKLDIFFPGDSFVP